MTGQWTHLPRPHRCAMPIFGTLLAQPGDEWTCDCGRVYVVQRNVQGNKTLVARSDLVIWLASQHAERIARREMRESWAVMDLPAEQRREHDRAWIQRAADRERAILRHNIRVYADNVRRDLGLPLEHQADTR